VVALLGWFAALATGRFPLGLRNAGPLALRYTAQVNGYDLLLTDSYPYTGPRTLGPVCRTFRRRPPHCSPDDGPGSALVWRAGGHAARPAHRLRPSSILSFERP
jgi:uncharacterized protein DUF4389